MNEKLKEVIHLLQQLDDELNNEICLDAASAGFDEEATGLQFTFWGLADMVLDYMQRRAKQ